MIWVVGNKGMLGSELCALLATEGECGVQEAALDPVIAHTNAMKTLPCWL